MTATFEMPATKEAFLQPLRDLLDQCMAQFNACPQQWVLAFPDSEGRPCGLVGSMKGRGIKYVNFTDTDRLEFADANEASSYLDAVGGVFNGHGEAFPIWIMDALDQYSEELEKVIRYAEENVSLPSAYDDD